MEPARQFSDSPVNFHLQKTKRAFYSRKALLQDQERIALEIEAYRNVLEANASIAKHSGVTLFSSRIETRICTLFSTPCPRVVGQVRNERLSAIETSWFNLMHENLSITEFHQTPGGDYVCCFGDLVIEMPEADRNLICSDSIFKLLHSPPDPADLATEKLYRQFLTEDLDLLYRDCRKVMEHIELIMPALGQDIHEWLDEVNATESNSEMTHEESSQELETATEENYAARMTLFDLDSGSCEDSLDPISNTPTKPLDRKSHTTKAPLKKGPCPQWTQGEKAKMRRLLRQNSYKSWPQLVKDFNEGSNRPRTRASIYRKAERLGLSISA